MAKKDEKERGILFYEEGYAENYLYKRISEYLLANSNFKYRIEHKNLKGEGNTSKIPNYYRLEVSKPTIEYTVFFCYDTDISERAIRKKPSVRWDEAKRQLKSLGVKKVYEIKQFHSIEDILLGDLAGVLHHLGLPANTKIKGTGDSALKQLYSQAGKVYVHSNQNMMQKLIQALDVERIIFQSKDTLRPLIIMFSDIQI